MTASVALGQIAAGFRLALTLFAVLSLCTSSRWAPDALSHARRIAAQRLNAVAWSLIAWSILSYSPFHAGWLLGHPLPPIASRLLDALASGLACVAMIKLIAFRGLMQGLPWQRIRLGIRINIGVAAAAVGAVWLTR